jgi:serine protease Do
MQEFDSQSLGSGFIISSDGYIISNNHVIKNADEVIVRLSDRREFNARVIGADERSDIALLKIDAENLPTARLGTEYDLKVGEWVLAIGSPFGFDYSVTAGIVSAKGRSLPRENYVPFIQTDVAINPGNSGGPLFNLDGQVVGVNSQIFSRTGGFMGLSFAIPIDVAMEVGELAESFGMGKPGGALIAKVLPDSPAEGAGFHVGDVVLSFNEHEVNRSSDLPPIVGRTRVGTRVPVEVLRNGETRTLYVVTAELPEQEAVTQAAVEAPETAEDNKLGLAVTDLTPEQREQMEPKDHGVLVTEVTDGPARSAGIRKGDVVLMLNGIKVEGSAEFKRLASELPAGKAVSILVQRQGNPIFLALKTEE